MTGIDIDISGLQTFVSAMNEDPIKWLFFVPVVLFFAVLRKMDR